MARHKVRDDGEEVVSEFVVAACEVSVAVNHEAAVGALEEPLDEFEREAAEAVAVGNHNLLDHACADSFQKGRKTGPAEVEARADVGDEVVVWVGGAEVGDLAIEVGLLVA